jgi:membrane-bound lytic murein transglycosylase B
MQKPPRISAPVRHWLAPALLCIFFVASCSSTPPAPSPVSESIKAAEPKPVIVVAPPPVPVPVELDQAQKFARWVSDFRTSARAAGIDEATLQTAFSNVRFVPRVTALDSAQPEFTRTVWDYLDGALSPQRIASGRAGLQQLRATVDVDAITTRYGIPVEILVAIWGLESNYGSHVGDIAIINSLATLGFEGHRQEWARSELLAALKILQSGDITHDQMVGSWAGAMGQTQFMPTTFIAYAVDADGDGRRDLWGSLPDVMASTANFLARSGWQGGKPWGQEVRLPSGFDYARADATMRKSAQQWGQEGVQTMNGVSLAALTDASILLPAGARGPAFLVGQNFRTLLRYNNSTSYALAVSLLAQRLFDGLAVQAAWPRDLQALTRTQVLALQTALNTRGFDCGTPDGMVGPATQRGIRQYQRSIGLPADGYPTLSMLQGLQ